MLASTSSLATAAMNTETITEMNNGTATGLWIKFHFQLPETDVQVEINQLVDKANSFISKVSDLCVTQKTAIDLQSDENVNEITSLRMLGIKERMDVTEFNDYVDSIFSKYLLSPVEIYALKKISKWCHIMIKQLGVLLVELSNIIAKQQMHQQSAILQTPSDTVPTSLIILSSPPSCALVKNQALLFKLRLVLPTHLTIQSIEGLTAEIVNFHPLQKKSVKEDTPVLEQDFSSFDKSGVIKVLVKFSSGSSKKPVSLRFVLHMRCFTSYVSSQLDQVNAVDCIVSSDMSPPYIVITNTVQWKDAEKYLLTMELFNDQPTVTFARFANALQSFYIKATRQMLKDPVRALTPQNIDYIRQLRFDATGTVAAAAFDEFWKWFGPIIEKLRHQKNLCPMWLRGYIYGLISKHECESILTMPEFHKDGAFIVRFSDHYGTVPKTQGKCTVAFVAGGKVWHFLIDDTDNAGNKRTVVDVLYEISFLRHNVQITGRDRESNWQCTLVPKDQVIQIVKPNANETIPGYDDLSQVMFSLPQLAAASANLPQIYINDQVELAEKIAQHEDSKSIIKPIPVKPAQLSQPLFSVANDAGGEQPAAAPSLVSSREGVASQHRLVSDRFPEQQNERAVSDDSGLVNGERCVNKYSEAPSEPKFSYSTSVVESREMKGNESQHITSRPTCDFITLKQSPIQFQHRTQEAETGETKNIFSGS